MTECLGQGEGEQAPDEGGAPEDEHGQLLLDVGQVQRDVGRRDPADPRHARAPAYRRLSARRPRWDTLHNNSAADLTTVG